MIPIIGLAARGLSMLGRARMASRFMGGGDEGGGGGPIVFDFDVAIDDRAWQQLFARFEEERVRYILIGAGSAGAHSAARVVRSRVPIGTSDHTGQWRRKRGLTQHGVLRDSATYARAKDRPGEVAWVIGPMGRRGFTRHWIEGGTKAHVIPLGGTFVAHPGTIGKFYLASSSPAAFQSAVKEAERVLSGYTSGGGLSGLLKSWGL